MKFLTRSADGIKRIWRSFISTSEGAGDANKPIMTNSSGKVDITLIPDGLGAKIITVAASENLAANDAVNLWNDAGTIKARKADATAHAKRAFGFVKAAVTSGANANVYYDDVELTGLSGLTVGAAYFLSDSTPGGRTTTPPTTGVGKIIQYLGTAHSTTTILGNVSEADADEIE